MADTALNCTSVCTCREQDVDNQEQTVIEIQVLLQCQVRKQSLTFFQKLVDIEFNAHWGNKMNWWGRISVQSKIGSVLGACYTTPFSPVTVIQRMVYFDYGYLLQNLIKIFDGCDKLKYRPLWCTVPNFGTLKNDMDDGYGCILVSLYSSEPCLEPIGRRLN